MLSLVKKTALLLAVLLTVMCCLCACSDQASTAPSSEAPAVSAGGSSSSAAGYSSSAGVDMGTKSSSTNNNNNDTAGAPGEIKFKNTMNWSTPYVYYWSDTDSKMTSWPGSQMKFSSGNIYTFTLPKGVEYLIFNDGEDQQTVDIAYDGSVSEYQLSSDTDSDGKYYAETWSGKKLDAAKLYDNVKTVNNSTLAISIDKAVVKQEYYTESFATNGGNDAVVFTVKNDSSDTIRQLTIYVVFIDADGNTVKPFGSYNMSNDINVLTTQDVTIQPGETKEIPYRCDADEFEKFDSVVANYIVEKTMYENTDADTWANQYIK